MTTPKPHSRPLTIKQDRFAIEYPTAPSGTDAALNVYDVKGDRNMAAVIASQNLRKPAVREAIDAAMQAATSKKIMTVIARKERLSELAAESPTRHDPIGAIAELNKMERVYGEPPARDSALEWLLELRKLMAAGPPVEVDQAQAPRLLLPGDEEREASPHAPQHDDKAPRRHRSDAV